MRSRSRVLQPTVLEYTYTDFSVGGPDESEGPFVTSFQDESMIDMVTPNFRQRQKKGEIIENPCNYTNSTLTSSGSGSVFYQGRSSPGGSIILEATGSGPITARTLSRVGFEPPIDVDPAILQGLIEQSRLKALASIDPSAISTGEDLLELGETLRFLKSPLRGIFNALSRKGVRSAADLTTDVWLSLRFGLTPMLMSINDILQEAGEFTRTRRPSSLRSARGFTQDSIFKSDTIDFGVPAATHVTYWTSEVSMDVKSTIHYVISDPAYGVRWRYGVRNKDILPSFWAVVPLSFMVDRIVDISSAIKAFQNLSDPSVKILGATTVVRSTAKTTAQVISCKTNNLYATYTGRGEERSRTFFTYSRIPYKPSLSQVIPQLTPRSLTKDLTSIADLAALIYSSVRK